MTEVTKVPPERRPVESGGTYIRVAATVASGLAINWISEQFDIAAPFLLGIALLALVLLVLAESPKTGFGNAVRDRLGSAGESLTFGLAAFLVGAVLAGVSLTPVMATRHWTFPRFGVDFYNYELFSFVAVLVLGVSAWLRRARLGELLIFGISAITGVSIVTVFFADEGNSLIRTFAGWSLAYAALIALVVAAPDIARLLGRFWRIGPTAARPTKKHGDPTNQSAEL